MKRPLGYERRITIIGLLSLIPTTAIALVLVYAGDFSTSTRWTVVVIIALTVLIAAAALRAHLVYPLRTLSNLLAALREEDFSFRARGARADDALGEVMTEVNRLGATLKEQRLEALEAAALLRTVLSEIDAAIFAFDGDLRVRITNRAGERLLERSAEQIVGVSAAMLRLDELLTGEASRTVEMKFPGGTGRWGIRRTRFRDRGLPHQLLVISDLSRALREEERQAWQRLVRVMGHELNNSLAPIKSIGVSLAQIIEREPLPDDWRDDARRGLNVISSRAEALTRFMDAYARLARLPRPRFSEVRVGDLVRRVVALDQSTVVTILPGPDLVVEADGDQIEQLLINVLRNAVDATSENAGSVTVRWLSEGNAVEILVEDEGPGIGGSSNLFVPFFTTKPGGTGIGLLLSRQIAEAHGGTLTLQNRTDVRGCEVRLRLPLRAAS